jgi:hypothetical protein
MKETFTYNTKSNIRLSRMDTGEVLYEGHNVICVNAKYLFAQLMANVNPTGDYTPPYVAGHTIQYPVWGLALGAGSSSWAPETQPVETASQTALITEFLRKPLSQVTFVDSNRNPLTTLSTNVNFQTTINATSDNITLPIREMGLIGGGSAGINMLKAPYFTSPSSYGTDVAASQATVCLLNYETLPSLNLPPGIDVALDWMIVF